MQKIILYGIGYYGTRVADYFIRSGSWLNIEVLAVTDKKNDYQEQDFYGFPFVRRDQLVKYDFDKIVVSSKKWYDEIKNELMKDYSIKEDLIILFEDFVDISRTNAPFFCNVCQKKQKFFWPCGSENPIFEKLRIIGGGLRSNGVCPDCASIDRDRWVWYILLNFTDILWSDKNILHIAPERKISEFLKRSPKSSYITGDIQPGRADEVVDLTNMRFEENSFDYIICNHVLEHIKEEDIAFEEIKRCLKSSGVVILSFPVCKEIDTLEDDHAVTEAERLKLYGQADHCRLYGKDAAKHIANYGFDVEEYIVNQILTKREYTKLGLIDEDTVYICKVKK